jgi:hypothetical protein
MTLPLGKTYPVEVRPDGRLIVDLAKCPPADPEPDWSQFEAWPDDEPAPPAQPAPQRPCGN